MIDSGRLLHDPLKILAYVLALGFKLADLFVKEDILVI